MNQSARERHLCVKVGCKKFRIQNDQSDVATMGENSTGYSFPVQNTDKIVDSKFIIIPG